LIKNEDGNVTATDDLGYLLKFMINLSVIASKSQEKLRNEIQVFDNILSKLTDKVLEANLEKLCVVGTLNARNSIIISQFLNCIESLIIYNYHKIKSDSKNVQRILQLYEKHCVILKETKKLTESSKNTLKSEKNKNKTTTNTTTKSLKIEVKTENIWDIKECLLFIKIFFGDTKSEIFNEIKQNAAFCKFVLDATLGNIKSLEMATEYGKIQHNRSVLEAFLQVLSILFKLLECEAFQKMYDDYDQECALIVLKIFEIGMLLIDKTYKGRKQKWSAILRVITKKEAIDNDGDVMLKELIERLQKIVEWGFEDKRENDRKFISVLNSSFATLNLLFTKYQKLPNEREFFNWILKIAKEKNTIDRGLSTAIIRLFFQNIQKHENVVLTESIASSIAACYKFQSDEDQNSEDCCENNFSIISISTVDGALAEFIDFLKQQLKVAECYIKKANSLNTYASLKGQRLYNEIWSSLQSLETSLCAKLLAVGKCIDKILRSKFDVNPGSVEKILEIIRIYYACLINLIKHFCKHHNIKSINYESISIQQLIKYSKQFSARAYSVPVYVENVANNEFNSADSDGKKKRVQEKRRDAIMSKITKNVPQMIFLIENYNTSVAHFDAIAKTKFSNMLHRGEVRDFHIKNKMVQSAIEKALTESTQLSEVNDENMAVSSNDEESENNKKKNKTKKKRALDLSADEMSDDASGESSVSDKESIPEVSVPLTRERFEKNVRKLSKRKVVTRGRQKK
jgi:FANCI solenoid 4